MLSPAGVLLPSLPSLSLHLLLLQVRWFLAAWLCASLLGDGALLGQQRTEGERTTD